MSNEPVPFPSFSQALRVWTRIGLLSFGGPAGQIALLHREVVEERNWISDRRFLAALNFCNLLPGPEAQQLATYLGWLMHGVPGGLAAGAIFVIPGAVVMLGLSLLYALAGQVPVIDELFFGLKSAVLMLVVEALLRIGRRALKGRIAWALAGAAFVAIFLLQAPFPLVVLAAAAIGAMFPAWFSQAGQRVGPHEQPALIDAMLDADPGRPARLAASARRAGLVAFGAWLAPVLGLVLLERGWFADIAVFFAKMAVVTLGGAYAVLAYVAQDAVQAYHWLAPPEMLAGLGLAETTPGPLILVLQFVGFLAGFRADGPLHGVVGGIAGAVLTLWVTFAPCFMFVFLGAPVIERLQANKALAGALSAVTCTVVGVIGNLAVWFALQVLFRTHVAWRLGPVRFDAPVLASVDGVSLAIAVLSGVMLFWFRLGVVRTLGGAVVAGGMVWLIGG